MPRSLTRPFRRSRFDASTFRRDSLRGTRNVGSVFPRFCLVFWFGLLACSTRADAPAWAHELSDLPPNPAVLWGRLENGLRYAVCPNAEPERRASLRLLVRAGSLHETERQRGYAHFVEHLAFDGTRLFPGQTLHAELQRQGLARGPDVNAHTHPDRTIYRLNLPNPAPDRLRSALQVLREFADGLTFDPAEVDRERGVVLIEKRTRDEEQFERNAAFLGFLFPGRPLASPDAFGNEETLQAATAAQLRDFYRTWYRADNLVVVAVGAFDPAQAVREIEAMFATMPRPDTPLPSMDPGPLGNPATLRVGTRLSKVGGGTSFSLVSVSPVNPVDTQASTDELLQRALAFDALSRRLDATQRRHSGWISQASTSLRSGPLYQQALIRLDASPDRWEDAVATLEQEFRRVLTHGFTVAELADARRRVMAMLEFSAQAETTRQSESLADSLVESIADGRVFVSSKDLIASARRTLGSATPESCLAAFRSAWGEGHPQLFASGSLPIRHPERELAAVYHRSARLRIRPPENPRVREFAYTDFGPPGRIALRRYVPDLDIHCIEFANGVRLNLKSTPFEAQRIVYGGRLGTGIAGEPKRKPGLRYLVDHGLGPLGLRRHNTEELQQLSAGYLASLSFSAGEDTFYLSGISDSAGAERMMQLVTAHLTDPGWHRSELSSIRHRLVARLSDTTRSPGAFLSSHRHGLLAGGDSRYRLPAANQIVHYSIGDLRAWIGPQLREGPFELGIVGDFEIEPMIALASRTVGCLRPRKPMPAPRRVPFVEVLPPTAVTVPAMSRNGAVQLTWPVPPGRSVRTDHQLELLAEVVRNRFMTEIRGRLGATYSAGCQLWRSEQQRETGYLIASLTCGADDVQRVSEVARELAAELSRSGVSPDEFERARRPRLETARVAARTNAFWLGAAVAAAQSQPEQLEWTRRRPDELEQCTAEAISALAAQVLRPERASLFTAVPGRIEP